MPAEVGIGGAVLTEAQRSILAARLHSHPLGGFGDYNIVAVDFRHDVFSPGHVVDSFGGALQRRAIYTVRICLDGDTEIVGWPYAVDIYGLRARYITERRGSAGSLRYAYKGL